MTLAVLPTRKDEAYRYADLDALTGLWPVARETIMLRAGESGARSIIATSGQNAAQHLVITLDAGARFDLRILSTGAAYGRIAVDVRLGEGADLTLGAAQLGGAGQTLEIVTEIAHHAPDAVSRQIVRSVLTNGATGTYLGRVAVARGADGTDGSQSIRAMLLDRGAVFNARPELEIYADDVKCAHGCAVGELDADGLFYLQSRGLPPAEARRLMLQAFVAEAFAGAPEAEMLQALALEHLRALL